MQSLIHTNTFRTSPLMVLWNRILRLLAVGRYLFLSAAMGLLLCYWLIISDIFGWQKGVGIFSDALQGLFLSSGVGVVVVSLLDARSRFQEYKRAKDLFFENGFKSRIANIYIYSRCQRETARVAAKDLGLLEQLDFFYQNQGYRWYHIFPDFLFKKPWIILSRRYWQKTLFEPQYTSTHFLW